MYGAHKGLDKGTNPEVNMNHLAAVVAIKVSNKTNKGPIKVKDVEFSVPTIYEQDELGKIKKGTDGKPIVKTPALAVAGDCNLTIVRDAQQNLSISSVPSTGEDAELIYSTKAILPNAVELGVNQSITFYLPIRPFSVDGTRNISIRVNSSERTASPAITFASGKVTTFNVPVNEFKAEGIARDEYGVVKSDAFEITSIGREASNDGDTSHLTGNDNNVVITSNASRQKIKVNGQDVYAYILGTPATKDKDGNITKGTTGTITITGFLKDLLDALPIKFYASAWGNEPAIMTVNQINVYLPAYYDQKGGILNMKTLYKDYGKLTNRASTPFGLDRGTLISVGEGVKSKITFDNIPNNGYYENGEIIVLNEGYTQKEINSGNIGTFLKSFSYGGNDATYQGLLEIANAELEKETIQVDWNAFTKYNDDYFVWPGQLGTKYPYLVETINGILGKLNSNDKVKVITALLSMSEVNILYWMRDAKVQIELGTMEDGPCVIFWGLDADTTGTID